MSYELWNIATPRLPVRSRLYSLVPMALGSPLVESVTSYLMRLAETHAVSPGTLVRTEMFPQLSQHPKHLTCAALHSLNGNGANFKHWVDTLEMLTARNDLRYLTLLPWRGVFSPAGVLRRHRAWCCRCYQERRKREPAVYDSLLWTLDLAPVCPLHVVPLEEICPHCRKHSSLFSTRGRPGFCDHCHGWLGSELPATSADDSGCNLEVHAQTARQLGDLLSFGATQSHPFCSSLKDNIQRAIADWAHGNRLVFCRVAGISDKTLTQWLTSEILPSLPLLVRLARNLHVPVKRMLIGEIAASDELWLHAREAVQAEQSRQMIRRGAAKQRFEHPVTRGSMRKLSLSERAAAKAEVKTAMEAALKEDVHPSVRDVFRRLGYRHCVMGRYWFPGLYTAIQRKRKRRFDSYKAELDRALNEMPPPTVTEVAQRLGVNVNSLRTACPELYRQLFSRRSDRQRFEAAQTEKALKKALEEEPECLAQLAVRLHRSPYNLRIAYPELCADLRKRYIAYQSMERRKLASVYEEVSREAIDEIIAAGKYPSCKRVRSFVAVRSPSLTSICLISRAVKSIRQVTAGAYSTPAHKAATIN